ncbi:MAG: FeoB small GTPase domain-containing protein [Planctomycetota bacterium]
MRADSMATTLHVTLAGNPNVGKSTLFNSMVSGKSRISNHPGITAESVDGFRDRGKDRLLVTDLPGTYSLHLDLPEAKLCRQHLDQVVESAVLIIVIDAMGLRRNFKLFSELTQLEIPMAAVVTKSREAQLRGYQIDLELLEEQLGIPVIGAAERSEVRSLDIDDLIDGARIPAQIPAQGQSIEQWGTDLLAKVSKPVHPEQARRRRLRDDRLDRLLIHPILGLV